MSERDVIERSARPATVESLAADLGALGLAEGTLVMVHSSLSALGYVVGGAQAVVAALLASVGPSGTVMMPSHSTDLSDPSRWEAPPVPAAWWDTVRAAMPAYDEALTPTRQMGAVVECFRHVPGALRSAHPTVSAVAVGPRAAELVDGHELELGLGERSPQARLYEADGEILLLGVGHVNNTSLHLAEHRAARVLPTRREGSPITVDGQRRWVEYTCLDEDESDFEQFGTWFATTGRQRSGPVGATTAHLMRARDVVDAATDWMRRHRYGGDDDG